MAVIAGTEAAGWELAPIDPDDDGVADYSGPLLSDIDFGAFSHSALVRIADEVCLQMQLLNLSFTLAVSSRAGDDHELATSICTRQLTGIAGVAAERIRRALDLPAGIDGLAAVLQWHPLLNPAGYVVADVEPGRLRVRRSPAHDDDGWIARCGPAAPQPLQAVATAVDPRVTVAVTGAGDDWTAEFTRGQAPQPECAEVLVTKVSRGASFQFQPRRSLPLTVR